MFDIENETEYPANVEKMAILYIGRDMRQVFYRYYEEMYSNLPSIIKDYINSNDKTFYCNSVTIKNYAFNGSITRITFEALCFDKNTTVDDNAKSIKCRVEVRRIRVYSPESNVYYKDDIDYMTGGFKINTFSGYLELMSDTESRIENKFDGSIADHVKKLINNICKENYVLSGSITDIKFYHSSLYDVTLHNELSEIKGIDKHWHTVKFRSNFSAPFTEWSYDVCFIFKGNDIKILTLERKK